MRTGPLYSIKKYCLWCCGDQPKEVKLCPASDCSLHPLRQGKRREGFNKPVLQAIKERCYDCSCFDWKRVRECDFTECALHPYRLGNNPLLKGKRKSHFAHNSLSEGTGSIQVSLSEESSKIVQ